MTPPTLFITDRLPFLWRLLGVNYRQLRAILAVKLQLDNRRPVAFNQWKKASETNNAYWVSLALYALFGAVFAFLLTVAPATGIVKPATLFFGYVLIVCTMSLISDFSSVVLDSSDNQIMLFRPVDSRTMLTARVVHIISYLFTIALAVGALGVVAIGYRFGAVAGLLSLVLCLMMAILAVFLTNVIYLLLMQFVSNDRLREVINYVQIGMVVFFYGGYQLLPRLMNDDGFSGLQPFVWQTWHYALPPLWSAGSLDLVVNRQIDARHLILLGLALVVPFAGLYLMTRVLAPIFSSKLATLDQEEKAEPVARPISTSQPVAPSLPLAEKLASWLTSSPLEHAGFTFVWFITGRDRKFKLRTYPGLGFGLAYAVVMGLNHQSSMGRQGSSFFLFILYFGGIYIMTALMQIAISDNYKAAWIYESSPMSQPGLLLAGGIKALVIKLMLPYFCLLAGYVLYVQGTSAIPDVLLACVNSLIMLLITAVMSKRHLPFSMAQDVVRNSTTSRSLLSMFIIGLIGVAHWGLTYIPYGRWVALPVMIGVAVVLFRTYQQTQWHEVEN
ncbi:hypothetical protein [Fibrella forsythiae]|uniref:ABC transporter permease n=1 Tax=Fibrella forsythiae TaxID=2817061 RepID=A0ABS3JJ28_9BACT|nr:hypothetical protein [Fibrella forsythiae]MBO0950016.1 hypothetical protein [Fibrella forsythiae]